MLLADAMAVEGDWLVARHQEAGKGRHGRVWQTIDGNFFGSTLVQLKDGDPPAPGLALVAGLALIESVEEVAPSAPLSLKWPNDLMLGDGKLAGILLERAGNRVVVGFGVNLAAAPAVEGRKTSALAPFANVEPRPFAAKLADRFGRLLGAWRLAAPTAMVQAWLERGHPLGTPMTVHASADQKISGSFDGLEADGAMRLRREDGTIELVRAGDVSLG